MSLVMNLEDPTSVFEDKHAPKYLTETDLASQVKVKMWELRINNT